MTIVFKHLIHGYRVVFLWFWGIVTLAFTGLMIALATFGVWTGEDEAPTAWGLMSHQTPGWFLFVIGILCATTNLQVVIANGITRRAFTLGAFGFFAVSAVLFGLLVMLGHAVELAMFQANDVLEQFTVPYPTPTPARWLIAVLTFLGFATSGYLIGLIFYRFPIWLGILLSPLAIVPSGGGTWAPWGIGWTWQGGEIGLAALVIVAGVIVAYLLASTTPVRPRKA